jgi:hypothetical protein
MLRNFSFNWLSYILGILSGLLIWFIISQLKSFFPQISRLVKEKIEEFRKQQLAGADGAIRQSVLKRAQAAHIASIFVPLDEIIVPPSFLAPPIQTNPGTPPAPETISDQIVPFLPFTPEFTAAFSPHRMNFSQILTPGLNIAVVGAPGSGKSVALAYLATLLSRDSKDIPRYLPIFLHVHDITLPISSTEDPLSILISFVQKTTLSLFQSQVPSTILSALKQKTLILIMDGLDELHPETELPKYAEFFKSLFKLHPELRMVVAADPHFLQGLIQSNFYPFIVAPFDQEQYVRLQDKWISCWSRFLQSKKTENFHVDSRLEKYWSTNLPLNLNPLEFTLRVWSLLTADLQQGQISYSGLETFLTRSLPSESDRLSCEKLAAELILNQRSSMTFLEIETFLSQTAKKKEPISEAESQSSIDRKGPVRKNRISSKTEKKSSGAQLLDQMISNGILKVFSTGKVSFAHPQIAGYLAAFALPTDLPRSLFEPLLWTINSETLHYIATQGGNDLWVDTLLRLEDAPLYWIHLTISRWLRDAPPTSIWRNNFLRRLISLIHKENIPVSIRAGFYTALLLSGDPSLGVVVKQLLASSSPGIRRLSAFAAGYLHANGLINDLMDLMADPDPEVGLSAIIALCAFDTSQTRDICSDILLNAGEFQRQAAAESLAHTKGGSDILINALTSDDLLARRAAIHGLAIIRTPEIQKILEKVSVEDGQWIVRTAAAEALVTMRHPDSHIPAPLGEPSEIPWLITYASKSGVVFSKGQAVTPILLDAIKGGSPEERLRAVDYLMREQDDGVIGVLYGLVYGSSEILSRSATNTLWLIAAGGAEMPSQTKYGYNQ